MSYICKKGIVFSGSDPPGHARIQLFQLTVLWFSVASSFMEPVHSPYDSWLGLKSPGRNTFGHDYEGISRKDRKTYPNVSGTF